jgi:hypothetical protein
MVDFSYRKYKKNVGIILIIAIMQFVTDISEADEKTPIRERTYGRKGSSSKAHGQRMRDAAIKQQKERAAKKNDSARQALAATIKKKEEAIREKLQQPTRKTKWKKMKSYTEDSSAKAKENARKNESARQALFLKTWKKMKSEESRHALAATIKKKEEAIREKLQQPTRKTKWKKMKSYTEDSSAKATPKSLDEKMQMLNKKENARKNDSARQALAATIKKKEKAIREKLQQPTRKAKWKKMKSYTMRRIKRMGEKEAFDKTMKLKKKTIHEKEVKSQKNKWKKMKTFTEKTKHKRIAYDEADERMQKQQDKDEEQLDKKENARKKKEAAQAKKDRKPLTLSQKRQRRVMGNHIALTNKSRLMQFTPEIPDIMLGHANFVKKITSVFARYKWAYPKIENVCAKKKDGPVALTKYQDFIRHYVVPRNRSKGIMLVVSTGGGKTCTAAALTDNFRRVIWVTKRSVMSNIWSALFADLCSGVVREWKSLNRKMPTTTINRLALLSAHGTDWVTPMTYRQFSNAMRTSGKASKLRKEILSSSLLPGDPLADAVIIFDESHLLYDKSLPAQQRPMMSQVERAIFHSYAKSGNRSCKVVLMSATPVVSRVVLCQQLNLMIENKNQRFPVTDQGIEKVMGKTFTSASVKYFMARTTGMISYLNAAQDRSKFAIVSNKPHIKVFTTDIQVAQIKICKKGNAKNAGVCIQKRLMVATKKHSDMFDNKDFTKSGNQANLMARLPQIAPRIVALMKSIDDLNAADRKSMGHTYKHLVFTSVRAGYGVKFVASALMASQKYNHIIQHKNGKLIVDSSKVKDQINFAILTGTALYKKAFGATLVSKIINNGTGTKGIFNDTDRNTYGSKCQVLIINEDYGIGIDAIDVRYVHFLNPQPSRTTRTQAVGRATRMCGSTNLKFVDGKGWTVDAYTYVSEWHNKESKERAGGKTPYELVLDNLTGSSIDQVKFTETLRNVMFLSAIDFNLNSAMNRFTTKKIK